MGNNESRHEDRTIGPPKRWTYAIDLTLKARVTASHRGLVFRISKERFHYSGSQLEANSQAKCTQWKTWLGQGRAPPWIKGARDVESPLLLRLNYSTTEAAAAALTGSVATRRNVPVLITLLTT